MEGGCILGMSVRTFSSVCAIRVQKSEYKRRTTDRGEMWRERVTRQFGEEEEEVSKGVSSQRGVAQEVVENIRWSWGVC